MKTKTRLYITILNFLVACTFALNAKNVSDCDEQVVKETKSRFLKLQQIRNRQPDSTSNEEFRDAAQAYIFAAELCYQAKHGMAAPSSLRIDDDGLWVTGSGPGNTALMSTDAFSSPQHNLYGTKWGDGSPFDGGDDTTGPSIAGGEVTYSFMADGVSNETESTYANATSDPNTAISSLETFESCFYEEISAALGAWSAVANITFRPVSDNGVEFNGSNASGDIRIGAHHFDGSSGTLAHGYYPPPNGTSASGDVHFDKDEAWSCGSQTGAINFGIVALHEFGHAIGLRHSSDDPAVMEPYYNPALTFGPLADDIIGAGEIYGGGLSNNIFIGNVASGTDLPDSLLHLKGSSPDLAISADRDSPFSIQDVSSSVTEIKKTSSSGSVNLDVNPDPADGTSNALFRFFRETNTNGIVAFDIHKGDGSPVINTSLSGNRDSFFNVDNGNVGIGTNQPESKLHVAGGDVKVTGGSFIDNSVRIVPDYVFEPDYELMPLSELQDFIHQKRHLPNIPSAKEIKQGGLNLSQTQMRLLEKIEELTLYTLAQEKTIQQLQSDESNLESRFKQLEVENLQLQGFIQEISNRLKQLEQPLPTTKGN